MWQMEKRINFSITFQKSQDSGSALYSHSRTQVTSLLVLGSPLGQCPHGHGRDRMVACL